MTDEFTTAQLDAMGKVYYDITGQEIAYSTLRLMAQAFERAAWQNISSAPKDGTYILVEWKGKVKLAMYNDRVYNKPKDSKWSICFGTSYKSRPAYDPNIWRQLPSLNGAIK